jgi:hypothetical protein
MPGDNYLKVELYDQVEKNLPSSSFCSQGRLMASATGISSNLRTSG